MGVNTDFLDAKGEVEDQIRRLGPDPREGEEAVFGPRYPVTRGLEEDGDREDLSSLGLVKPGGENGLGNLRCCVFPQRCWVRCQGEELLACSEGDLILGSEREDGGDKDLPRGGTCVG
jgi:hypothetical protein